jgi:universal stress protein E
VSGKQAVRKNACPAILAAADLSEDSDPAILCAVAFAEAHGAELHVHHCVPKPVFPYWQGRIDAATRQAWLDQAQAKLQAQLRRSLADAAVSARSSVSLGEPVQEITQQAIAVAADLIVVGPHRPRGRFDDLLGSTADRLIRTAGVPCLIAHRAVQSPLRRVLFPTDFSQPARHAIEVGVALLCAPLFARAGQGGSTVVELLFVGAFAAPSRAPLAVAASLDTQLAEARRLLDLGAAVELRSRVISAPLAIDGIRTAAEELNPDLIVLGTHGHGTLGRALIGSVASAVARSVPVPQVLVPPPPAGGG